MRSVSGVTPASCPLLGLRVKSSFVLQSDGTTRFLEALRPSPEELETLLTIFKTRVARLAQGRGLGDPDPDPASTLLLPGMDDLYSDPELALRINL